MKKVPDFDIELSQAVDYIFDSPLAQKTFSNPPFPQYTNVLRLLIQSVDRLADNCHMPEFTNHALPHICSIVRRASEWAVEDKWLKEISEKETGYLLLALVIHDIGMLSQDSQDLPEKDISNNMKGFADISNWVRRTHVIRLERLVLRLLQDELDKDEDLKIHILVVIGMAASHQCWEWEPNFLSQKNAIHELGLLEDKIAALNAVIAVCDLLDEDSNRCDTITLIKYRHGTMENMAHWIRHALTAEVEGVKKQSVNVLFRKLQPSNVSHEKIYRALRNHYRLVKLYNNRLKVIGAEIKHINFNPTDGIPELEDEVTYELKEIWQNLPEFKNSIVEQILSTFMREALNQDGGNAQMRKRLDDLGLETIDLTNENIFLNPQTIIYPEEKVLISGGKLTEQLKYIKDQVDSAYLDGNIGKIRHLCFVAWKRLQKQDEKISLNEIYWIYVYLCLFQKYGNEIQILESDYINSLNINMVRLDVGTKTIIEGAYHWLIDVWFMLQKPCVSNEMYEKYKKHIMSGDYKLLNNDIATGLLLENVIGTLWYFDQEGNTWEKVARYLIKHTRKDISVNICNFIKKIKIIQAIMNYSSDEARKIRKNEKSPFARAWIDFWHADIAKQEKDIPELCEIGNKNHDYMGSVQGYLNIVLWNIYYNKKYIEKDIEKDIDNKKDFSDSEINDNASIVPPTTFDEKVQMKFEKWQEDEVDIGRYRYGRIILEQSLPIFWEQRNLMLESLLAFCVRRKEDSSSERIQILRLVILQLLDSIRYWNLSEFIDAISHECRLNFLNGIYKDKHGKYRGNAHALVSSFIDYIKCLQTNTLSKEEQKNAANYLLKYYPEGLDDIVDFIVNNSLQVQWKGALSIIEIFAENITIAHRRDIISWLVKYDKYYKKQKQYLDTTQYQFLRFWLKEMELEDWKKIQFIFDEIFASQGFVMTNTKLVDAVFDYAPWELAEKYLNQMIVYPNNDRKSVDIFSAIISLSQRNDTNKNVLQNVVSNLIIELNKQDEEYVGHGQFNRIKKRYEELNQLINVNNLYDLETVDLNMIEDSLKQLYERVKERGNLTGYDNNLIGLTLESFSNRNWSMVDIEDGKKIVNQIFEIMKLCEGKMSNYFFHDFCKLFDYIESSCNKTVKRYINEIVIDNMVNKEFTREERSVLEDGPYNSVKFFSDSEDQYEIMVILLIANGMTELSGKQQQEIIRFVIKALRKDIAVIYNYATIIFSYLYLVEDVTNPSKYMAWGGLQFISGRVVDEKNDNYCLKIGEIRSWMQKAIVALEDSINWFGTKGYIGYIEDNKDYIEWIESVDCTLNGNIEIE